MLKYISMLISCVLLSIVYAGALQANIKVMYPNIDGIGSESIGFHVHKKNTAKFAAVKNITNLQQYVAGQGLGWGDIAILENAGIKVVKASRIQSS